MDTGFPPPGSGQPQEPAAGPLVSGPIFSGGGDVRDGPGHYTMVREGLSADPSPAGPMAKAPQSAPPPDTDVTAASTPKRRSPILTILGLVVIVLAIVALVVAFALTS